MRSIYSVITGKKSEYIKIFLVGMLLLFHKLFFTTIQQYIFLKVGEHNAIYVSRVFYIILMMMAFLLYKNRVHHFMNKNYESLRLLGVSDLRVLILILSVNSFFLFGQVFLGTVIGSVISNGGFSCVCYNIINSLLCFLLVLWCETKRGLVFRLSKYFEVTIVVILGVLVAIREINYTTAYRFIMSDFISSIFFDNSTIGLILKMCVLMMLTVVVIASFKNIEIIETDLQRSSQFDNFLGDSFHKLNFLSVYSKNYVWIYKNKDYVMWKIFSTILLLFVSLIFDNAVILFISYGICLVNVFYLCDIYNFERKHYLIYMMSDYSYSKMLSDFWIGSFGIIGDNVLLLLLVRDIFNPTDFYFIIGMVFVMFLSFFMSSHVLVSFPIKKHYIHICLFLIKMHIPILNVLFLLNAIKRGKRNWGIWEDGYKVLSLD